MKITTMMTMMNYNKRLMSCLFFFLTCYYFQISHYLGVLPHALKTKCGQCTEIQKEKALDVITRLYYKYPNIYIQLAEKYDPKGVYTKNFESWFDEQNINRIKNEPFKTTSKIPSTWITRAKTTTLKPTTLSLFNLSLRTTTSSAPATSNKNPAPKKFAPISTTVKNIISTQRWQFTTPIYPPTTVRETTASKTLMLSKSNNNNFDSNFATEGLTKSATPISTSTTVNTLNLRSMDSSQSPIVDSTSAFKNILPTISSLLTTTQKPATTNFISQNPEIITSSAFVPPATISFNQVQVSTINNAQPSIFSSSNDILRNPIFQNPSTFPPIDRSKPLIVNVS
jgi:hypothetical protein